MLSIELGTEILKQGTKLKLSGAERITDMIIEKKQEDNKIVSPYTAPKKTNDYKYIIIYICALIFMVILIVLIIHFIKNSSTDNLSVIFDEFERRF